MSEAPLQPVYLLSGTDQPKRTLALKRLRERVGADSVETLAADSSSGEDAVAACNALGLFAAETGGRAVVVHGVEQWRKADIDALAAYLAQPAPDTVLMLVAEQTPRDSSLATLCKKHGEVLQYEVPKRNLSTWVRSRFEQAGANADAEAAHALVEICGDDPVALAAEVDKLAAWAAGEPIGRAEVEVLAAGGREATAWALTDAWGARDLPALLAASELALERKDAFSLAVALASHVARVRAAQLLAREGVGTKEIAKRLRYRSEFPARKAVQHAENYSTEELDGALVRLAELDAALKGNSRLAPELELERALIDVTRPAARAGAGVG